jgi:uncharacterized membrane protein YphA (DoxX/SURF4 family)
VGDLGYTCALALAAVFVRAGAAKLARPSVAASSFAALGAPAPTLLARGVPLAELLTAVALIASPRAGAAVALLLLAAFSLFLGRAVASGATAPCNCFGAARAEPVSAADLARNGLLAAPALAALAATGPEVPAPGAVVAVVAAFALGLAVLAAARARYGS